MANIRHGWCSVTYAILMTMFAYKKVSTSVQQVPWTVNENLNGYRPTNGTFVNTRSSIHCGLRCTSSSTCLSFFYTRNDNNGCQLMTELFTTTTGFIVSPNSKYYGPIPDTYNNVVLTDGTKFKYRLGLNPVNKNQAEANCSSDGGHLVRITSAAKIDYLRTILPNENNGVSRVCTNVPSTQYRGTLESTDAGDICQRWDSQTPHGHPHNRIQDFPETVLADAANYCRDPDQSGQIWCMTTNPSQEWDWCTTTDCYDSVDIPTHSCYTSGDSVDYSGTWSVTKYGRTCQRWDSQSPHTHSFTSGSMFPDTTVSAAENYCRDPDNRGYTWCYTTDIGYPWEPCYIRDCLKDIPERKCYDHPTTQGYVGTWNLTSSGFVCQRWDFTFPHTHVFTPSNFPDVSLSDAGNYCRDPDNRGYLWCYTTDDRTEIESCDIPKCDGSDGYHVQGTNQNALNEWQFANGEAIETSSWGTGKPDYSEREHCARMDSNYNWNLNDGDCAWNLRFICEK